MTTPDYHSLIQRLFPREDGEPPLKYRKGICAGVGSGVIDVTLSGVIIPDVPIHGTASINDEVHLLTDALGRMLAIGECGGGGGSPGDLVCEMCALGDLGDVVIASPSDGDVLTYNGGVWQNQPGGGGGGAVPRWIEKFMGPQSGEIATPNADSKYFPHGAAHGGTLVIPAGTLTVSQIDDVLSMLATGAASGDMPCILWPLSAATTPPITLEVAARSWLINRNVHMSAVMFTDGTSDTSATVMSTANTTSEMTLRWGTITNITSNAGDTNVGTTNADLKGWRYQRIIWTATNTWYQQTSRDGVSWRQTGPHSVTHSPTHFGVGFSPYGDGLPALGTYEYLRVYGADLTI